MENREWRLANRDSRAVPSQLMLKRNWMEDAERLLAGSPKRCIGKGMEKGGTNKAVNLKAKADAILAAKTTNRTRKQFRCIAYAARMRIWFTNVWISGELSGCFGVCSSIQAAASTQCITISDGEKQGWQDALALVAITRTRQRRIRLLPIIHRKMDGEMGAKRFRFVRLVYCTKKKKKKKMWNVLVIQINVRFNIVAWPAISMHFLVWNSWLTNMLVLNFAMIFLAVHLGSFSSQDKYSIKERVTKACTFTPARWIDSRSEGRIAREDCSRLRRALAIDFSKTPPPHWNPGVAAPPTFHFPPKRVSHGICVHCISPGPLPAQGRHKGTKWLTLLNSKYSIAVYNKNNIRKCGKRENRSWQYNNNNRKRKGNYVYNLCHAVIPPPAIHPKVVKLYI